MVPYPQMIPLGLDVGIDDLVVEVLARLRPPNNSELVIVDQAPQERELLIRIQNLYCRVLLQVADKRAHALMEFGCVDAQFLFQEVCHPGACEQTFQLLD